MTELQNQLEKIKEEQQKQLETHNHKQLQEQRQYFEEKLEQKQRPK